MAQSLLWCPLDSCVSHNVLLKQVNLDSVNICRLTQVDEFMLTVLLHEEYTVHAGCTNMHMNFVMFIYWPRTQYSCHSTSECLWQWFLGQSSEVAGLDVTVCFIYCTWSLAAEQSFQVLLRAWLVWDLWDGPDIYLIIKWLWLQSYCCLVKRQDQIKAYLCTLEKMFWRVVFLSLCQKFLFSFNLTKCYIYAKKTVC